MKKAILALIFMFSLSVFGDRVETDNVIFNKGVSVYSNIEMKTGSGKINFQDKTSLNTNSFTPEDMMMYPVFIIPLDGEHGWSEVELKATTNNFTDALQPIYWLESLGNSYTAWTNYPKADLSAKIYYCYPDSIEPRAWVLANKSQTLTQQIGANGNYQVTVVVVPSFFVNDGSTNTWMYKNNDNLIWVYRRRNATDGEKNTAGKPIWHPIVPVDWRRRGFNISF